MFQSEDAPKEDSWSVIAKKMLLEFSTKIQYPNRYETAPLKNVFCHNLVKYIDMQLEYWKSGKIEHVMAIEKELKIERWSEF